MYLYLLQFFSIFCACVLLYSHLVFNQNYLNCWSGSANFSDCRRRQHPVLGHVTKSRWRRWNRSGTRSVVVLEAGTTRIRRVRVGRVRHVRRVSRCGVSNGRGAAVPDSCVGSPWIWVAWVNPDQDQSRSGIFFQGSIGLGLGMSVCRFLDHDQRRSALTRTRVVPVTSPGRSRSSAAPGVVSALLPCVRRPETDRNAADDTPEVVVRNSRYRFSEDVVNDVAGWPRPSRVEAFSGGPARDTTLFSEDDDDEDDDAGTVIETLRSTPQHRVNSSDTEAFQTPPTLTIPASDLETNRGHFGEMAKLLVLL